MAAGKAVAIAGTPKAGVAAGNTGVAAIIPGKPPIPPMPPIPPTPGTPPTGAGANGVAGTAIAAGKAAPNAGTPGATVVPGIPPKTGKVGAEGTRPTRLEAQKGPPIPVVAHSGAPIPVCVQAGIPVVAPARKLVTQGGGICALQLMISVPKTEIITKLINKTFKNLIFIHLPLSSKLNKHTDQFSNELCPLNQKDIHAHLSIHLLIKKIKKIIVSNS
jgi:hypothetical protein